MKRALTFLGRALATVVIVLGAGALVVGVLVPRLGGATPYTVETGSMAPRYPVGTLVVVRPVDPADLKVGDVVTYQIRSGDPTVVTHRVVGLGFTADGEPRYTTRGDANDVADPAAVTPDQVRGRLWYAVPFLGYAAALFGGTSQWITTAVAVLLVGYALWQVVLARRDRASRQGATPHAATVQAATVQEAPAPTQGRHAAAPVPVMRDEQGASG